MENRFTCEELEERQGVAPGTEHDIRRMLDDPDIDAVLIATPDHWHALATIWACQAGKDVYVEKPCCHNIWEGRQMVAAALRYDRIVAVGFQNRSILNVRAAMRFLHEGGIGDVFMARGLCFKPRDSIGRKANAPGYMVGGKTGTADKLVGRRYANDARTATFVGAFPMDDPRYVILAMVDEPKGNERTYGYATGGWVAAPVVRNVVERIGPLVGIRPRPAAEEAGVDELLIPAKAGRFVLAAQ